MTAEIPSSDRPVEVRVANSASDNGPHGAMGLILPSRYAVSTTMTCTIWLAAVVTLVSALTATSAAAQGNFEIQVYGSELTGSGQTMVELHSNTAIKGTTRTEDGVVRTQGAVHETLEITYGFTEWFETAFYLDRKSTRLNSSHANMSYA